ncbi:PucR family transcriptional regulator ligand-binding domain-containing protein [Clostridium sp. OS1-26]|uniref:PucR family transcriptional regulator n=1 Tax=Clostridium sp. OS1-26 TaxID=3070681 RepID=UPI0027DF054B|nr:PucR family transcriptional regulator ligand-binding domain-containing protein [Clostridium sp. OS1-26]WML36106.1 PucR family transcriptional regulator ligand-binding domain-containing protein [Clostridium sp. OS1-26]
MSVRFDQLLNLPELKNLKLVSGAKGISKIVRWVHVIENPEDAAEYVQSDELIIVTGVNILNRKDAFINLIENLIDKKAAGLVVNIGKYIEQVPDYVKSLSDANNFPVFEFPWKVSLTEITRVICGDIVKRHLEEVSCQDLLMSAIFFNTITYEDFLQRISGYGYDSLNSVRIIIVNMDNIQLYLNSKNINDEQCIAQVRNTFLRSVNSSIWESSFRPISFLQNYSVVLLLINEKDRCTNLTTILDSVRENSKNFLPEISIGIGVGEVHTEFSEIKKSYIEAEKALKVTKAQGELDKTIFYEDIGVYKILTEIHNIALLREYYDSTVGKLKKYDEQNHTDLTKIFYVFLMENGNCIQTSKKLYLHRNTLIYKINKIEELIKRDLGDTRVRLEFYMGYLIKELNDFTTYEK